jgi:hypothetical protein
MGYSQARLWYRHGKIIRPFFFHGFWPVLGLALLGLYAFGPFASNEIESNVRRETAAALAGNGIGWARVSVSGQDVFLSGDEPAPGAGDRAMQVAREARCQSWLGYATCAVTVISDFNPPPTAR